MWISPQPYLLLPADSDRAHQIAHTARQTILLLKTGPSLWIGLCTLAISGAIWLYAGRRERGVTVIVWLIVPAMFGFAALCIAGPGRLFPKRPYEGSTVIQLSHRSGITTLDLIGLGLAATAALVGGALLMHRSHRT